jgi:hypothetical protein
MQDQPAPAPIPPERLRRAEAAAYLRAKLGQNVSPNTLRSWPIRYRQLGRDAVYEVRDLDAFSTARIAAAPERSADLGRVFRGRLRLLRGDLAEDEAQRRAHEYVVRLYMARHGSGIDDANKAVRGILAQQKRTKP